MSIKTAIPSVDATPIKNVYLSIIADYNLKTAICELIDNSIDAWRASHRADALQIKIEIDEDQQTIKITDNAGGVPLKDLKVLVSPGASLGPEIDRPIGAFGVGSKRAVVALAELIWITTRYKAEVTHRLEYDDEWIHDPSSDWSVGVYCTGHSGRINDYRVEQTQNQGK
ncbi:MAG: ATP-binding protein [Acidobacteria bacterium]|nr:ATP-binding protein [Acidobacteriota bacterium]